jgi:O-antigen/teichoic acid export membrane protein
MVDRNASAAPTAEAHGTDLARVARGMAGLVVAQLLSAPLGMLVSAVLARNLGPSEFGALYVGQTAVGLGFLFVEWGQGTAVAGAVALARGRARSLLGTSLALKLLFSLLAVPLLLLAGSLLGYSDEARLAVLVLSAQALLAAFQASGSAVLRGYERTDQVSLVSLLSSALSAALVIPAALLGAGLRGVLLALVLSTALLLPVLLLLLRRQGVGRMTFSLSEVKPLLGQGSGFLLIALVLALQPYVDNAILARLAPAEVMGWHAASRRMTAVLLFPATTLAFAIYPTLARLGQESPDRQAKLVRVSLRLMLLSSVPAAVGTVLFARPAVHLIYGSGHFEPVVQNLQLLSPWVLLVYFSILLGTALLASGRTLAWSGVQFLCVVVSIAVDPILIPYFQSRFGNGSLGVGVATVASEGLMLVFALGMVPRAMLGDRLWLTSLQAAAAGGAMALVATVLSGQPAPLAIGASLLSYVGALLLVGGLKRQQFQEVSDLLRAKIAARTQ